MRIDYHRTLIADRVRNAAFYDALKAVIVPGKTIVADIGAGTGLLGLMASKLGARDVFLYEAAGVAGVAAKIIKANKARNCHVIPCHSTEMHDPPKVDVVVSETLGNYAFEENIIATLADARARFLKPGGIVIPRGVTQKIAPVTSDRFHRELTVWREVGFGIDLGIAQTMSLNNIYVRAVRDADLMGGPAGAVTWDKADLTRDGRSARKGDARFGITTAASVFGFALWWDVELTASVSLSTAPGAPATHWEQLYLPLLEPMGCAAGETIAVAIRSKSSEAAGTTVAWTASRLDRRGKELDRQTLDLDKGFLP